MVEKQKAYLCVGGPYAGRRYAVKDERMGFRVPKLVRHMPRITEFNPALAPATVEYVTYVADRIRCANPDDEVWFWRPLDQSVKATMELLLERYEQANNIIWQERPFE